MSEWLDLAGARVLVAGGGGLGAACVLGFARAGANVVVADRDSERLDALVAATKPEAGQVSAIQVDLAQATGCEQAIAEVMRELGGLDVLVHCLGVNDRRPILDFSSEEWEQMLTTNLTSAFRLAQAAGRVMVEQESGRIVFLSSVSGLLAHKNHGPYAASKGGMNQLMRVMAAEWAATGVTVNAVAPGYVETPLTAQHLARPGVREDLVRLVPAGRLGAPEDVVGPVLFLASKQASFVTGHVLYVDGGRTLV